MRRILAIFEILASYLKMNAFLTKFGLFFLLVGPNGCREKEDHPPRPTASAKRPTAARKPAQAPLAKERVDIPAGSFFAGSVPGQTGRRPALEERRHRVDLGAFQIDRLPFPNDPSQPPRVNVSREEAQQLCEKRNARLCTELEWERTCKGPASDPYPTGNRWDPKCAESPRTCATGFDVLNMGVTLREWTASDVIAEKGPRRGASRGASRKALPGAHRCAHREGLDPALRAEDLGFRCCSGAPNAAVVTEPRLGVTFRRTKISAKRLEALLAKSHETRSIAKDVKFFREPEAANTVISRGPGDKKGFLFTVSPMIWNPVAGSEFLLVAARAGKDRSFVVAFHVLSKKEYRLAASFIMEKEPGPIAFAYSGYIRPRLHFSSCWGCPGETGKLLHREPDSVRIEQP